MDKLEFVYVIQIATAPEKLWRALLDGEITSRHRGHRNVSDWKVGSTQRHQRTYDGSGTVALAGKVLEFTPPKRLVLTSGIPADEGRIEKHARVTFDIEPLSGTARLTVTHDLLEPGSDMLRRITRGWPAALSTLKTLLGSGRRLPAFEWYSQSFKW